MEWILHRKESRTTAPIKIHAKKKKKRNAFSMITKNG